MYLRTRSGLRAFPNACWPPVVTVTTILNISIMKTAAFFRNIAAAVLLASALASCSKDLVTEIRPADVYTFALSEDDGTKTVLAEDARGKYGHWESGDRLGSAVENGKPGYSYVNLGKPSTFSIYRPGGLTAGETVYVYYPYNSSTKSVSAVQFEIPEGQYQTGTGFDFDAMPMVAAPYIVQVTAVNDKYTILGDIKLHNLAAMAEFKLFSSKSEYCSEIVTGVRFETDSPVAGPFSKDITAVSADNEESLNIAVEDYNRVETTVTSAPALGTDAEGAFHVYMVLAPGAYTGTVIVTTDKAEYTYTISSARQFRRSAILSFTVDLANGSREATEHNDNPGSPYLGCYEVPGAGPVSDPACGDEVVGGTKWHRCNTSNPNQRIVVHTFYNSYVSPGRVMRSYTLLQDYDKKCALWVACAMNNDVYPQAVSRKEKWCYDPALPNDWQPNLTSSYPNKNGKSYDRGHQLAASYRETTEDQVRMTCYFTNMTPQLSGLNQGKWQSDVEAKVRALGAATYGRDTLYVVSGPLFIGEYGTVEDKDGVSCACPTHYFQCFMKVSFSNTGVPQSAKGAAYLVEHVSSPTVQYKSIDEIEEMAGFDFFANVPSGIQATAESTATPYDNF